MHVIGYNNANMFRRALIIGINDNLVSGACDFEPPRTSQNHQRYLGDGPGPPDT